MLEIFDFDRLMRLALKFHDNYIHATPFPHLVIDNFGNEDRIKNCANAYPARNDSRWFNYPNDRGKQTNKQTIWDVTHMHPEVVELFCALNSPPFVSFVETLTGIPQLITDPSLYGAGMHQAGRGGMLGIHVDHDFNPQLNLYRRVTALLYVSNWQREFGGDLELWDGDTDCNGDHLIRRVKAISPQFNRMVIFSNSERSFHGYPKPIRCPSGSFRQSLATFYLSVEPDPSFSTSKHHKARFI